MPPSTSYFFDLSTFRHADLFTHSPYPWIALQQLGDYLKKQPLGLIQGEVSPSAYLVHPELISIGEGTAPGLVCNADHKPVGSWNGSYAAGIVITQGDC